MEPVTQRLAALNAQLGAIEQEKVEMTPEVLTLAAGRVFTDFPQLQRITFPVRGGDWWPDGEEVEFVADSPVIGPARGEFILDLQRLGAHALQHLCCLEVAGPKETVSVVAEPAGLTFVRP